MRTCSLSWVELFLLVPAYPGCPGQKPLNGCVCVCVCVCVSVCVKCWVFFHTLRTGDRCRPSTVLQPRNECTYRFPPKGAIFIVEWSFHFGILVTMTFSGKWYKMVRDQDLGSWKSNKRSYRCLSNDTNTNHLEWAKADVWMCYKSYIRKSSIH